jgi:hypothetical protein
VSALLSQLLRDGLWLAACMLAVAAVLGVLTLATYAVHTWVLRPFTAPPARADAPGFPPGPSRAEQAEAIRNLCATSEPYVYARLYAHEAELSHLAELLLELDDMSPMPDDDTGTWRTVAE